jgi:hypothetical protein
MPFTASRRAFLNSAAVSGAAIFASSRILGAPADKPGAAAKLLANSISVDDLPRHFDVEPSIHNLENGYWSIMPRVVAAAYAEHGAYINRTSSIWARNVLPGGACLAAGGREAMEAIARQVGCQTEEIAVTRSGAEALQMLIVNYRNIKSGDAVIHCDLDYDAMIAAMDWLGDHRGAQVVKFAMPEPATTARLPRCAEPDTERQAAAGDPGLEPDRPGDACPRNRRHGERAGGWTPSSMLRTGSPVWISSWTICAPILSAGRCTNGRPLLWEREPCTSGRTGLPISISPTTITTFRPTT